MNCEPPGIFTKMQTTEKIKVIPLHPAPPPVLVKPLLSAQEKQLLDILKNNFLNIIKSTSK